MIPSDIKLPIIPVVNHGMGAGLMKSLIYRQGCLLIGETSDQSEMGPLLAQVRHASNQAKQAFPEEAKSRIFTTPVGLALYRSALSIGVNSTTSASCFISSLMNCLSNQTNKTRIFRLSLLAPRIWPLFLDMIFLPFPSTPLPPGSISRPIINAVRAMGWTD